MTMERREMILATAGVLAAGLVTPTTAAEAPPAFAEVAGRCVVVGNECLQHCLDLLAKGDTAIADCAREVRQMLAICAAAGPMAAAKGKRLAAFAKLCADVCGDCESACRKHEADHEICKRCAEACAAVVAEARKLAA
ncbi:MAG: Csp1 family four helix bundle copper storage protein [bacterium]